MSGRSALLFVGLAACGRTPAAPPEVALDAPAPSVASAAAPSASTPPSDAATAVPWPALVRDERWGEAWNALDALPDADKQRPEIRYVRARVALAKDDAAAALPLLDGLEASLPLLSDDIGRRRAQAMADVGPYAQAGAWFAARAGNATQLDAARAYEKASDPKSARAAADRVLASAQRSRAQEGEARAVRVRTGVPPGDPERADARWLATQGADLPAAADALEVLARIDPGHPLGAKDWLLRAHVLSEAGRIDDALHAVDQSGGALDAGTVSNLERARARGAVLYHARGHGIDAAKVLTECAGAGGPHAAEDAFHAARALSRADRDDDAIRGYEDVERRFPKTSWARQAAFFVPYLHMLHGRWRDCAAGFDAYLRADSGGDDAADAGRDGALCKMLDGQTRPARTAFERLADDTSDATFAARMADAAALAALRDGDRTHAVARWTDVARSRPLTWPALVARARLAEASAPLPPVIDPADATPAPPPLSLAIPPPSDVLHGLGLDSDAEDLLRAREPAVTSGVQGRAIEALCGVYGELGIAHRRYQIAQSLPSKLLATAPGPATRWAWECAFPAPYADEVHAAEQAEDLPPGLLWAVMRQESGFDPDAVSPAHAVGLMQLLPETARPAAEELGLPRDDARLKSPSYSIAVAAHCLHGLLEQFHGQVALAVAAYNGGADSVERWLSRAPGMQLDTFVERIPFKETREYVSRVMGNLARYEYLGGGDAALATLDLTLRKPARSD